MTRKNYNRYLEGMRAERILAKLVLSIGIIGVTGLIILQAALA